MQTSLGSTEIGRIFDTHSETYDSVTNGSIAFSGLKVDFFVRAKAEHLLSECNKRFGATDSLDILDVGCGIGKYHGLLRPRVGSVSGVEVSASSLDIARNNHSDIDYRHYNGARLPWDDASFDVAYTVCVMHHVPPQHWQGFADEMLRVVRPGGIAVVFEHNPLNPLTRKAVNDCPYDEDAVLLRPARVHELFRAAGADRVSTEHILTIPAISGPLKAMDRAFGRLPFGAQYCTTITKART